MNLNKEKEKELLIE